MGSRDPISTKIWVLVAHVCQQKLCERLRMGVLFQVTLAKSLQYPISMARNILGVVAGICHPSYGRKCKKGGSQSRLA
jgi:hypothetical protein